LLKEENYSSFANIDEISNNIIENNKNSIDLNINYWKGKDNLF